MSEVTIGTELSLSKPEFGVQKKVIVSEVSEERMGGHFYKRKIEADGMNLVVRRVFLNPSEMFPQEKDLKSDAERYVRKWQLLREAGVPTASSMRVVDGGTVAMGDMTRDGSRFFGKEQVLKVYEGRDEGPRELNQTERLFLAIDSQKIKDEMARVLKLAWDKGMRLPFDDPYDILIHPDGKWEVLVLDLAGLRPRKSESEDVLESELEHMTEEIDLMREHLLKISAKHQ